MLKKLLVLFALSAFCVSSSLAAGAPLWSTNGEQVIAPSSDLIIEVKIVEDGSGGMYVIYRKEGTGAVMDHDLYAARVDEDGGMYSGWPVTIRDTVANSEHIAACSDGSGGVFVVWEEGDVIYGQRIASSGSMWPSPLDIESDTSNVGYHVINSSGSGKMVVAYQGDGLLDVSIFAAIVDIDQNVTGVDVATDAGDKSHPNLSYDPANNKAFISWTDGHDGGHDIYIQRLNVATGALEYPGNPAGTGVKLSTSGINKYSCSVPDGSGGAIVAWEYQASEGAQKDLYLRTINSGGTPAGTDPLALCDASQDQTNVILLSDGAAGAAAVWDDCRNCTPGADDNIDIYAQRVNSSGSSLWASNGIPICTASGVQRCSMKDGGEVGNFKSVSDGYMIGWDDYRRIPTLSWTDIRIMVGGGNYNEFSTLEADIYAQKIDSSGNIKYIANGVPLTTAPQVQAMSCLCNDASSGVIGAFLDARGSTATSTIMGVSAQRMTNIDPTIYSVSPSLALPGGSVTIAAQPSVLNGFGSDPQEINFGIGYETAYNYVKFGAEVVPTGNVTWAVKSIEVIVPSTLLSGDHTLEVMAYGEPAYSTFTVPTDGPVVSNVKFNGVSYVSGDYISSTPTISAEVLSAYSGVAVEQIEVNVDGTALLVPLTDYDPVSGLFAYTVSTVLLSGSHTIRIRGTDSLGLTGSYYTCSVVVGSSGAPETSRVTVYPPVVDFGGGSSGASAKAVNYATIAYQLTADAPVDIKLYSAEGSIIWSKIVAAGQEGGRVGYNEVRWYGDTLAGAGAGNGIYPFQIVSGGKVIGRGRIVVFNSR